MFVSHCPAALPRRNLDERLRDTTPDTHKWEIEAHCNVSKHMFIKYVD